MVADLMDANPEEVDGYIASGGTEANIVGCWMGRNRNRGTGRVAIVCSFLTHYSIRKAANLLGIAKNVDYDNLGLHILGTDGNGHLLLDQFETKLKELAVKGVSNIIAIGNAGTTMLGSVDDIPAMSKIIEVVKISYPGTTFHFHVDAAFGGFVIPFLGYLPKIGFTNPSVDSITIDVHKMGLAPYGSGIILARRGLFNEIKSEAPYVPGDDSSLCGSRPGAMALSCWTVMKKIGKAGYASFAHDLTEMAYDIQLKLRLAGLEVFQNDINILAIKGKLSQALQKDFITHTHRSFPIDLSDPLKSKGSSIWNIVVMHHTKMELIDELIAKLKP